VIFILLILIGPVGIWYLQHELNKVWELAGTGAAPAGLEGGAAAPPPQGQPAAPESRPEVPGQG
jgi:hypothetical protein